MHNCELCGTAREEVSRFGELIYLCKTCFRVIGPRQAITRVGRRRLIAGRGTLEDAQRLALEPAGLIDARREEIEWVEREVTK